MSRRGLAGPATSVYAEAAQDVENKGDLGILGQPRMAVGEHHAEQIVFDRIRFKKFRGEDPFTLKEAFQFRCERSGGALTPQHSSTRFFAVAKSHAEVLSGAP